MNGSSPCILIDASIAVMWYLPHEPHAAQARELFVDWQHGAIDVNTTDQFPSEIANALLSAVRRNRLTLAEASAAIQDLLTLRLPRFRSTAVVVTRAWEIASTYNQRVYDCVYVAIAERKRLDFWTADRRLHNALGAALPFVRLIADYTPQRP